MSLLLEIKPLVGFSELMFGGEMTDAERIWGTPEDTQLMDDLEDYRATVWHYWADGFTLFFDEQNGKLFSCVETTNSQTLLWGQNIFAFTEKQIIDLFKTKNINAFETEQHEWGEKRLSFDEASIDFYFERNRLVSVNACKPLADLTTLILKN